MLLKDIQKLLEKQGDNLVIKDNSGNGYDATAIKATVETTDEGRALKLNGDGYLQMQHSALKWPYTLAKCCFE